MNFPIRHYWSEYKTDIDTFIANNSTWYNLSPSKQRFYIVFPIPWFVAFLAWYGLVWRSHRKKLIINGVEEGTITWIYGEGAPHGHIYDFFSALHGFKYIPWTDIPRPISQGYARNRYIIYFKLGIFHNPLEWRRLITVPECVRIGIFRVWVQGNYKKLIVHPTNPILNYEVIINKAPYQKVELDISEILKLHRDTQDRIMNDNYRMTTAEPGCARRMIQSSMMAISPENRERYIDLMTPAEKRAYLGKAYATDGAGE